MITHEDGDDVIGAHQRKSKPEARAIPLAGKINFLIFCAHNQPAFANYYQRLHERAEALRRCPKPEVLMSDDRKLGGIESRPEVYLWDWRGVPKLWPFTRYYSHLSDCWIVFVVFKTLLYDQLAKLVHLLIGWPGHCVILGRYVIHPTISGLVACGFCWGHIAWRYVQYFKRCHMMSLFAFLLQTQRDLEQFYALMRANHRGDYLGTGTGAGTGAGAGSNFKQAHRHDLSREERFLRHILCYEVHLSSGRIAYKLRPNRKLDSHAYLSAHSSLAVTLINCLFITLAALIYTPVALIILTDLRYVQIYPGCSPHLDYLYTSGQLKSLLSLTFTWHRAITFVFDLIENTVIWYDSGFAMTYVMIMAYLMNQDLLLYWRHLNARLHLDLARVRELYGRRDDFIRLRNRATEPPRQMLWCHLPAEWLPSTGSHLGDLERQLIEAELNELQCELSDFFTQLERVDKFISDVLSVVVSFWLLSVAGPSYFYLARVSSTELPPEIRFIQVFLFLTLTIVTFYLLQLHSSCKRSYELICSIMAHDLANSSTRLKFLQVLEFFTDRKSTTYTVFQRIPYLATTYLTLIGWSFSSMAICNGLFGRERYLSSLVVSKYQQVTNLTTPSATPSDVFILGGPTYSAFSSSL